MFVVNWQNYFVELIGYVIQDKSDIYKPSYNIGDRAESFYLAP